MMKHTFLCFPPETAMNFIANEEGFRACAYRCPAGILTIGFGHTGDVKEHDVVTLHEAEMYLRDDIEKTMHQLAPFVNVTVTKGQFIALTSLAFNVGPSYVVQHCPKLMHALNTGDTEECARQFLDIVHANGKRLEGLVKRRERESRLFLEG